MMKRRQFLQASAFLMSQQVLFFSPVLQALLSKKAKSFMVTGHALSPADPYLDRKKRESKPQPSEVRFYDEDTGSLNKISVPFYCHGFSQHPTKPEIIVGVEKWGRGGGVFDLNKMQMIKTLEPVEGLRFFGHCAFSPDGQRLFVSANPYGSFQNGELLVYDSQDWSFKKSISVKNSLIHDVELMADRQHLMLAACIADGKNCKMGNLIKLHLATYQIESAAVGRSEGANHLLELSSGQIAVGSYCSNKPNAFVLKFAEESVQQFQNSKGFHWNSGCETLSLAQFDDRRIVLTLSKLGTVVLWDHRQNTFIELARANASWGEPRGVLVRGDRIWVNWDGSGILTELTVDSAGTKIKAQESHPLEIGNGSHLYSFSVPTA